MKSLPSSLACRTYLIPPALRSKLVQILPIVQAFIIFIKLLASRVKLQSADYITVYVLFQHKTSLWHAVCVADCLNDLFTGQGFVE